MTVLQGTTYVLIGRFKDPYGVAFNPTTVTVTARRPSGNVTYTFGVDGSWTNPVTGTFHFTGVATEPGDWVVVMQGAGAVGAGAKKSINVTPLV
jgi:hypothetical protein